MEYTSKSGHAEQTTEVQLVITEWTALTCCVWSTAKVGVWPSSAGGRDLNVLSNAAGDPDAWA